MANENSSLVSDIYHSRNNLMDIMEERGFNVDDYNHFSITEVNAMNKNEQLDLLLTNVDDSNQPLVTNDFWLSGLLINVSVPFPKKKYFFNF